MATVSWTLNAGQALQRAYLMLGNLTAPYAISDFQQAQGIVAANATLKGMGATAPNVFRQTQEGLTVSAGVATVPIPNDAMGIEEARWVVSTSPLYERPLGRFQYTQYMQLPNKNAQGAPTIFMFDYQTNSTQLYAWPVNQTAGTINATIVRRANDIILLGDAIDLPSEWILGFTYMLAETLMDDQGVNAADQATADHIRERSAHWKDKLENFDRPTSVFIKPWGRKGQGPFWRG